MLVIISDTHLTDGTSGHTVRAGAFRVFAQRLRDLAYDASWRPGSRYEPIKELHLLLLGDILDVIRSAQWLNGTVRPWDDPQSPAFSEKVAAITAGVLEHNRDSLSWLKRFKDGKTITVPPATADGKVKTGVGWNPDADERLPVDVHLYYMVGNHDWFYHVRGEAYDKIRQSIVDAIDLDNPANLPFPHDPGEFSQSSVFTRLQREYADHRVFARHGDIYDAANFDGDRDKSSLGDAVVIELIDRFSPEVRRQLGAEAPADFVKGLEEIDNVRPLTNIPAWIDGLVRQTCPDPVVAKRVKDVWNHVAGNFFKIPFVHSHPHVEWAKWAQKLTGSVSFSEFSELVRKLGGLTNSTDRPNYTDALHEQAFLNRTARAIVYGHTHQYMLVPLESSVTPDGTLDQIYLNSGTWRPYHELAKRHPNEEEFVPYQLMTYLAFFKDGERGGRHFETWNGALDMV